MKNRDEEGEGGKTAGLRSSPQPEKHLPEALRISLAGYVAATLGKVMVHRSSARWLT